MQRLDEGLNSSIDITFVSAPAGYGKTTCISKWTQSLDISTSTRWPNIVVGTKPRSGLET